MRWKKHTPEEIVAKLRQVDVLVSQGAPVADAVRQIGVSEVTYYRWRREYGGLKVDQVKRLKELELENGRLRRVVSDLTLDKLILQEAAPGKFLGPARRPRLASSTSGGAFRTSSERRASAALGQHRSTQRKVPRGREAEQRLTADLVALARRYGRLGYRKINAVLRSTAGWVVNDRGSSGSGGARGSRSRSGNPNVVVSGSTRWIMHPPAAGAPQSRLVLRLCRGPHP